MTEKEYLYSEIFKSIQGEGTYTGVHTLWLRFFMCNLQCNGFGQLDPKIQPIMNFLTKILMLAILKKLRIYLYGTKAVTVHIHGQKNLNI